MILSILRKGTLDEIDVMMILLSIPVVLISLSMHEAAHGLIADKMGDPTARYLGRITLNPVKHLDPLGTVAMLLVGYGWAKPVPINPRNFKHPRKGMALTGLAGPVSNLILAFIGVLLTRITVAIYAALPVAVALKESTYWLVLILVTLFTLLAEMNVYLAIFNMIPVPPFDGSRVFYFLLPDKYYFGVMRYERQIMMVTFLLLATGVLSPVLSFLAKGVLKAFDFVIGLVPFL